ncbi:MAG: DUF805 domain-containing protein [Deltaproteobacteria bacterium]|nr:MAG: DUF805 domain-containing protein [Deltaproteobacteria bacterium]
MSLVDSVRWTLRKYATFSGRSSRSEYWYFFLFNLLVSIAAIAMDNVLFGTLNGGSGPIDLLTSLALFIPGIAVTARRLHDTGRSGWWMLLPLTIIGIIPYLIWVCSEGSREHNRYGLPVAQGPPGT